MRRLIGEVPTILRYMYAVLRQEREVLCLFACKSKHFLSIKPTFLATKSSRISNPVVRGRKLADFLSLLPLFLRRAPSLSLCAPPFVPVLFARFTHSPRSLTRVGACAHSALSNFPFFAFTHPLYPLDILRFVGEDFVFPDFLPVKLEDIRHLHT